MNIRPAELDSYRFKATKTGRYRIEFDGIPGGNGYDLSFKVGWQVQL